MASPTKTSCGVSLSFAAADDHSPLYFYPVLLKVARTLSKLLTTRRPKLISGPEVFNNLLGSSEQKVRELFKPAEEEWKRKKESALLHVIIIDEIDALARSRGGAGGASSGDSGSSSGAHRDSVVNQLLAKIDGLEQQNNVLVIGTTNRLDMIDPAVINTKNNLHDQVYSYYACCHT